MSALVLVLAMGGALVAAPPDGQAKNPHEGAKPPHAAKHGEAKKGDAKQEQRRAPRRGLAPLPAPLTSFGGAIIGDWLYVYSGHVGVAHEYSRMDYLNAFVRMNIAEKGGWQELAMGPTLQGLAMVAHEGKVIRIGGMAARNHPESEQNLHSTAEVAQYDPATDTWTALTPLPEARSSHDAAVLDGKLYVVGGWTLAGGSDNAKWLDHGWVADLSQDPLVWKPLPAAPVERRALAVAATDDYVYAIGGLTKEGKFVDAVSVYDPKTGKWSVGPEYPAGGRLGSFGIAAFGVGDNVWASGRDGVVRYLPDGGDKWIDTAYELKEGRMFHRLLPHADKQLLFIGGSHHGHVDTIETAELSVLLTPPSKSLKTAPGAKDATSSTTGSNVWPGFRGAGDSRSEAKELPLTWSAEQNVAWTATLPSYGQSSPVVWRDKVFVTSVEGDMQEKLHVVCVSLKSGQTLWAKAFDASQTVKSTGYVSKAAPTPAVDGDRVYVFFESGDLIALDHAGEVKWQRALTKEYGNYMGNHGVGASVAQTDDAVIVLADHDGPSYLLSVDKQTGENNWKVDREKRVSWSSPVVVNGANGAEIIVSSNGRVEAIDAGSGRQMWFLDGLEGNTVPSPSVADDIVVIGTSDPQSSIAVKRGGTGDVSKSHVAWRAEKATSSFGSPLVHGGAVYYVNRAGVAFCVDLKTGKMNWAVRLSDSCWASPIGAGDRVYFFCKDGETVVVKAEASEAIKLSDAALPVADETRVYGVAAVDGAFVIRNGGSTLTCVGTPSE